MMARLMILEILESTRNFVLCKINLHTNWMYLLHIIHAIKRIDIIYSYLSYLFYLRKCPISFHKELDFMILLITTIFHIYKQLHIHAFKYETYKNFSMTNN